MDAHDRLTRSLAVAAFPKSSIALDAALVVGGALLTTVASQIQIPWQPVPFTMQTLAVALCGLALGSKRGVLSQIAYLGAGLIGLPVFAEGKFGPAAFLGPTGGFLVSFVAVAWLLGCLADRGLDRKPLALAAGIVVSNIVLFGIGWAWLSLYIGGGRAFEVGVLPFVASEAVKDLMAVMALPAAWWIVGRRA
jgi:biotin transport system substrate-specific component